MYTVLSQEVYPTCWPISCLGVCMPALIGGSHAIIPMLRNQKNVLFARQLSVHFTKTLPLWGKRPLYLTLENSVLYFEWCSISHCKPNNSFYKLAWTRSASCMTAKCPCFSLTWWCSKRFLVFPLGGAELEMCNRIFNHWELPVSIILTSLECLVLTSLRSRICVQDIEVIVVPFY